jgi:hypothetical protein
MSDRTIRIAPGASNTAVRSFQEDVPLTAASIAEEPSDPAPRGVELLEPGATDPGDDTRNNRIRARAEQLWQQGGQLDGKQEDHWLQAEQEIDEEVRLAAETPDTQGPENPVDDAEAEQRRPLQVFPPFDDPAFSPEPAQPPLGLTRSEPASAADFSYASHPEFTQNARLAPAPQRGILRRSLDDAGLAEIQTTEQGLASETEKRIGAGTAIPARPEDADTPAPGRQPEAEAKD